MKNNSNFWKNRKILPSITTITNSNWRKKIEEIKNLGLKEICLFPTCLDGDERKELYRLMKETKVEKIPLVHIKGDMKSEELDFLRKNYQTEVFNVHSKREYPYGRSLEKHRDIIYLENTILPLDEAEVRNFAGVCLDLSHLENNRLLHQEIYNNDIEIMEKYPVGCNHFSAVKKDPYQDIKGVTQYSSHYLENLSELDYLKRYPASYFSAIIAIELENTIEEQLKAKDYLIDLLKNK